MKIITRPYFNCCIQQKRIPENNKYQLHRLHTVLPKFMKHKIEHDRKYQQFIISLGPDDAELAYSLPSSDVISFTHTYVPEDHRGNGLAEELITSGLEYAQANNLRVRADCEAVEIFLKRHPEYNFLLD